MALPSLIQAFLLGGALLLARVADGSVACSGGAATAAGVLGVVAGPFVAVLSAMLVVAAFIAAGLVRDFAMLVVLPQLAALPLRGKVMPVGGAAAAGDEASVAGSVV